MLYRLLEKQRQKYPRKTAVIGERRSLSYSQLFQQARRTALYLQSEGFRPGQYLVAGLPPGPDFYILFYAAAALGCILLPVPRSGRFSSRVLAVGQVGAVGDREFLQSARAAGLNIGSVIHWNRKTGLAIPKLSGNFARPKLAKKAAVLGVSTSGTTGEPVIFLRSAAELYHRAKLRIDGMNIRRDDVLLSVGPFTSGVNAVFHLVLPLIAGCEVVVLEQFDRRRTVDAIRDRKVTVLCSIPLTFEVLAHLPGNYSADFSSLRLCISNGAPLSKNIYERFRERFGIGIGQMYGGSDFAPAFTFNRGNVAEAVGQRSGYFPTSVVDSEGHELRNGETGEIVFDLAGVKNRALKSVLRQNPHRRGDFLYTGDLGRFDGEDNLFVVGRKNSLIKVGAMRVMAGEVENVLRSHPKVRETLVFPLRAGETDEAVGAVVVRDGHLSADELAAFCAAKLERHKCPRQIFFRRALPRNQHGKISSYLFLNNR
jgi:long-chain acyl-CoA synthetase